MKKAVTKKTAANKKCLCPFCEDELMAEGSPFCNACRTLMNYCVTCKIVVERGAKTCPRCGGVLS